MASDLCWVYPVVYFLPILASARVAVAVVVAVIVAVAEDKVAHEPLHKEDFFSRTETVQCGDVQPQVRVRNVF